MSEGLGVSLLILKPGEAHMGRKWAASEYRAHSLAPGTKRWVPPAQGAEFYENLNDLGAHFSSGTLGKSQCSEFVVIRS